MSIRSVNNFNNDVVIEIDEIDNSKRKRKVSSRRRLFEIIEVAKKGDLVSLIYDVTIIASVVISLIPLAFKSKYTFFNFTDIIVNIIFIVDYIFRLITADYKLNDRSFKSFLKYPFTLRAIVDFLSILPAITMIYDEFKLLRVITFIKTLKILRIFKTFKYSKSLTIISAVIKNSKQPLIAVATVALGYVLISALIIFNVEEESFDSFFSAVYWATISLTTVGYGDIYPVTTEGRIISMISSVCGIALVALPAGIITAGYMETLNTIMGKTLNSSKYLSSIIESDENKSINFEREHFENDITNFNNI